MEDLSKIIKEFGKLPYKGYVRKRTKRELTDSYFYLTIQLDKCMVRDNLLSLHIDPVRTKMTGTQHVPILHVCSMYIRESKDFLADEKLSQICFTGEDK